MKTYLIYRTSEWGNFLTGQIVTQDTLASSGIASQVFDNEQLRILGLKPLDKVFTVEQTD